MLRRTRTRRALGGEVTKQIKRRRDLLTVAASASALLVAGPLALPFGLLALAVSSMQLVEDEE